MFCVTLNVLLLRYVYRLRQRWILTVSYLLFPLILCFLAVLLYGSLELVKYESRILEHDERSLLRIPDREECALSGQNDCQLKLVVCPDGAEEHQLVDQVVRLLQFPGNSTAWNITYVTTSDQLITILVKSNSSWGLFFHQITRTKLEYTIRPRAEYIPSIRYDWGDYATTRKYPSFMFRGPRLTDPYFNIINDDISRTGFLPLQVAIDKAYTNTYFPNVSKEWILTSFPYPSYSEIKKDFRDNLSHSFYIIFVQYILMMGITVMVSVFASYTIIDKRSGIREWLCLNGAIRWMVNINWLVSFCFEATILAICEMVLLKIPTVNGPAIKYMSASVLTIVLIVYNWLSLCWVYLIATILDSEIICILLISAYWMFSPSLQWISPDCFVKQGFLAVLPNAGMVLVFKAFLEFDGAETVLDFSRLTAHPIHYLSVGYLLLIMMATSVLLILLSLYADIVRPGLYGRPKPWYLISGKENIESLDDRDAPQKEGPYFEEISGKVPIGLECVRLFKFFRTRKIPWWQYVAAVKNVNMKIPKNKITVILGPNGAGKTALFSMICGFHSPSTGHLYTEEYDIFHGDNMKKFRKVLGYCPQSNFLMNELTVKQHLIIFGLLKRLPQKEATENMDHWIRKLNMEKFQNTRVYNLSGGIKRKLCLAIAMTGDVQYLLLDEPSSGLDAGSVRTFWNILLQEKGKRTVVLSTHNMDEAEVLGDHIAIMVKGQLKAFGSSSFLKEQRETGYKLNITFTEKDSDRVVKSVRNFDNSITILYQTHNSVSLGFPIYKSKAIPNLMKRLESEFGDAISTSFPCATTEDVLVNLLNLQPSKKVNYVNGLEITEHEINHNRTSNRSYFGQITAIFKKRMKWIRNQSLITVILLLLVIPLIGIYVTMYFTNKFIGEGSSSEVHTADLKLTTDVYNDTIALVATRTDDIETALKKAMRTNGIVFEDIYPDMVDFLNLLAKKDLFDYRSKVVLAFDTGDNASGISVAYYSRNAFHSAPIAYSALMNAILLGNATITTHNFPYVREGPSCMGISPTLIALYFKATLGPILLMASSYFVIFPHIERRTLFKHLQLMTGLLPSLYWLSNFVFDLISFSISVLLIIVILAAKGVGIFLHNPVMLAITAVLILYCVNTIVFAYACSFLRCSTSTVIILFLSIPPFFLIGNVIVNEVVLIHFSFILHIENLYFLPWVILMESLQKILMWAGARRACHQCKDVEACEVSTHSLFISLKAELVSFAIMSFVYFTFSVAMDHGFGRKLGPMIDHIFYGDIEENRDNINQDMKNEKERVKYFEMDDEEDRPELICDELGKKYSTTVTAVRGITFAHERGSILGLLGTYGTGKSTILRMLSAVISPTKGLATVRGKWEMSDCEYLYIRNIGYYPQFGGILPGLTARDALILFGRLRGLKSSFLNSHVERWLQALDMTYLADRPSEGYSNGNKRKLSFAIAMIGFPSLVLLDEPTEGIDFVVRRRIWDILLLSRGRQSQAIILTSRFMSECEPICDRLAILIEGEIKSLGSIPKLKSTFEKSCNLLVKLQDGTTPNQQNVILRKIFRESQFSRYAKLQEKQINFLSIIVRTEKINVYDMFSDMLKIKEENTAVEDFILSETPLEEDFIMSMQRTSSATKNLPAIKKTTVPMQPQKKPR